jgi:alpha-N-acetylglucosaminidase
MNKKYYHQILPTLNGIPNHNPSLWFLHSRMQFFTLLASQPFSHLKMEGLMKLNELICPLKLFTCLVNRRFYVVLNFIFLLFTISLCAQKDLKPAGSEQLAAKGVIDRNLGQHAKKIKLLLNKDNQKKDSYTYEATNGTLIVEGNSAIALTRGVYDYLKNNNLGMLGWNGPDFRIPEKWPIAEKTNKTSPFKWRQAYNAVTPGYTTPFWTWERWEQELDWQAMHGFNMLMAHVATEAIATRVWKKLGLTQGEIDSFYVGPSLLPWQRMGGICQVGGTLPPEWHADQIALQHRLLKRMRDLGIQPVVQSFAGFVPKAIKRIYPDLVLHNTLWNSGFPPSQRPVMLMPGHPLFAKITKMYMEEWQKEFGEATFYLVDSFNELELPDTGKPVNEQLAEYGKLTFEAIRKGNPKATWVIQGWMFGYQRHIWSPDRVKALFEKVPDDGVLILDYANDYANSWEPVNGFNGKQWVYGFVPNMGGKTPYTGDLHLYATGAAKTLASAKKNNLIGFSISGEGLENNEVIYELLTDAAWSADSIDLNHWLKHYSKNRYGDCPDQMVESWNLLRQSAYGYLVDHPQFNWQTGSFGYGRVDRNEKFFKSVELFLSLKDTFKKSKAYEADAIERAALVLGLKAEEWFSQSSKAYKNKDHAQGDLCGKRALEILAQLDKLLESHPLLRLDKWLSMAEKHSNKPELKQFYKANARQIITIWGPPVNDYSCRVWSGLVRDFYSERMRLLLQSKKTGIPFNKDDWELNWVKNSTLSHVEPYKDPVAKATELVSIVLHESIPNLK